MKLYEPIQTLQPVASDVWLANGPAVRLYGIPFPTRMSVVRMRGVLWVHSPIAPSAALVRQVAALGPVAHVVAPNWIHYVHVAAWKKLFPAARLWAAPGVRQRASGRGIPIAFDAELGADAPAEWSGDILQRLVTGSRVHREVVFFHMASRTLILTDLIENFERDRIPWWFVPLARLAGVLDPHGGMPRDMRATFRGHHAELREHIDALIAWAPQRVILAHGKWYERDGADELARAFSWLAPARRS